MYRVFYAILFYFVDYGIPLSQTVVPIAENPVEMTENPTASCENPLKMKDMTLF